MKLAGAFSLVIILVPIGISPPYLIASWQGDWMMEGVMMTIVLAYVVTVVIKDILERWRPSPFEYIYKQDEKKG